MSLKTVCGAALLGSGLLSSALAAPTRAAADKVRGLATLTSPVQRQANLPLVFEPNQGQTDGRVQYLAHAAGYTLFLTPNEAVMALRGADGASSSVRMRLEGAASGAPGELVDRLPGVSNYFVGRDASQWRTNVPQYGRVRYRGVYPGIDVVYYGNKHEVEYDFVLQPGADPDRIQLSFRGADGLRVDQQGDLVMSAGGREVRQKRPVVYQEVAGRRVAVESRYVLKENGRVQMAVAAYDRAKPLVIDPAISYSTYLGGTGTDRLDSLAVDNGGNTYLAGSTDSVDFPTTSGAYAPNIAANTSLRNAYVAKLNQAGTAVLYATYIGPADDRQSRVSVAVDSQGSAYITGRTSAANQFPTTTGAYRPVNNGAFVAKLSATGASLLYSTGIDSADSTPAGVGVDSLGNAYIAGYSTGGFTSVPAPGIFPTAAGITQAFAVKLNSSGTNLIYATRFGGSGFTFAIGIAVDPSGQATIAGSSTSSDFPTSAQAYQRTVKGGSDAFVVRLNPGGTAVVFSTLLGGVAQDQANAVAIDAQGNTYIAGTTNSAGFSLTNDFPVTAGAYQYNNNSSGGFVAKFDPTGTTLRYSALFGSVDTVLAVLGVAVDSSGNAYVAGGNRAPVADFPAGGLQPQRPGITNGFVLKFNPIGSSLLYGTYLGGTTSTQQATAIATDSAGGVYVGGSTSSTDFPVTQRAFQSSLRGSQNAFVVKLDFASACTFSLSSSSVTAPAAGGSASVGITAAAGCNWIAISSAPWLTLGASASSSGTGPVNYLVEANYTGQSRTATITVGGETYTVTQPALTGCNTVFSVSQASFTSTGGTGSIALSPGAGCPWSVSSDSDWLTIGTPSRATGSGSATFQVAANPGSRRSALLKIYDKSYTVTQASAGCLVTLSVSPVSFPAAGGSGTLSVTAPSPNCPWSVTPSSGEVLLTGIAAGAGTAAVPFLLPANPTIQSRTFSFLVEGQTVSVSQAGIACVYTLAGNNGMVWELPFSTAVQLQVSYPECPWTAVSDSPWLIVDTPTGKGSADIPIRILANSSGNVRTGNVQVGGQVFTLTQVAPGLLTHADPAIYDTFSAFSVNRGSTLPLTRKITLTGSVAGETYYAAIQEFPTFLSVTPNQGTLPGSLTLTVNPAGLSPGTYTNTIRFTSPTATTIYTVQLSVLGTGTASKTGVYHPADSRFLLDRNGDGSCCDGDLIGSLGQPGDIPLAGDWTGDGLKKPGTYRPSTGLFLLDINNNASYDSGIDKALLFAAQAGDIPVVGDWNGSGIERPGVFRGSTGTWYLDVNGDGTFAGRAFLGQTGDTPIVGNWNGVGSKSKVGIFRTVITNTGSYNYFLLDYDGDGQYRPNGSVVDPGAFLLGQSGDVPIVGDWSGDGKTKVGIFRPSSGLLLLDQNGSFGWDGAPTDKALFFAPAINGASVTTNIQPGDLPVTGDWVPSYAGPNTLNLRGRTRTGIYRPSTGTFFLDVSTDGTFQGRTYVGVAGDIPVGVPVISNGVVVGVNGLGNY